MIITEYECKKCNHAFTRLFKDIKEKESLKEKCANCENVEIKELQSIDLPEGKPDCNTCPKKKGCRK